MAGQTRKAAAERLRALHEARAGVLILPNAWDAGSAAVIALAGAQAIATTSGGIAWSAGRRDGQGLARAEMIGRVREIVAAVAVPVTADVEGGYGTGPRDVALTVEAVIAAGAVGVNIEDSRVPGGPLFEPAEQAARIQAARAAAASAGLAGLFINARTDVFLYGVGTAEARPDDVLARCRAYAGAGADGLFVPGLLDLEVITELAKASPLPVNVMAGPGAPPGAELAAAGVRGASASAPPSPRPPTPSRSARQPSCSPPAVTPRWKERSTSAPSTACSSADGLPCAAAVSDAPVRSGPAAAALPDRDGDARAGYPHQQKRAGDVGGPGERVGEREVCVTGRGALCNTLMQ